MAGSVHLSTALKWEEGGRMEDGDGRGVIHRQKSKVRSDLPIFCLYTASNLSFIDTVKTSFHRPTRPAGKTDAQGEEGHFSEGDRGLHDKTL